MLCSQRKVGLCCLDGGYLVRSCLRWYGHVIRGDTNSKMQKLWNWRLVEKGKRSSKEMCEECVTTDSAGFGLKQEDTDDHE